MFHRRRLGDRKGAIRLGLPITPTNVDPSIFLQDEDYDLKERIND